MPLVAMRFAVRKFQVATKTGISVRRRAALLLSHLFFTNLMLVVLRLFFLASLINIALSLAIPFLTTLLYRMELDRRPAPVQLAIPVDGVKRSLLRDSWHAPRSGGRRHEGIDIFAKRGTPVRATADGIVLRASTNRLGGKVVWTLGPGGQRHYYAHLDRFADVRSGQRIVAGTVVGYVGTTGNARGTPPHLHYGIYTRRGPINPFDLLKPVMPAAAERRQPPPA